MSETQVWQKQPLGGVDRRLLAQKIPSEGPTVAAQDLERDIAALRPMGLGLPADHAVLMLGGSGGILRALAIQLLFGERVPVYAVHYDSEKLQIGAHHARAMMNKAAQVGVACEFINADATKAETAQKAIARLQGKYRVVHLINGIAAGATKRFAEHGPTQVQDIDVAFDTVRQIADFSTFDNLRRVGKVEVEVATPADIERTYKFMGHSTAPWVESLAGAGLLAKGESMVAFTDYRYEADDPVYAMGPLAQAKVLQRESLNKIAAQYSPKIARLCYPAMNTTALGAIPGGLLMYAGTAQILVENGTYATLAQMARDTLEIFTPGFSRSEVFFDEEYQKVLPEFHRRKHLLTPETAREQFSKVFGANLALSVSQAE